jgi:adenylate cyclase class 2
MEAILTALGYKRSFRYEKYRAEWSDGTGDVVLDETPIGNFGEIEGPPDWIDRTAKRLGVNTRQYITSNYATLFLDWKKRSHSKAKQMTFQKSGIRSHALSSFCSSALITFGCVAKRAIEELVEQSH